MPCQPASDASSARTAVVWDALGAPVPSRPARAALDVVDIGGGTGGFAVRVAELGHRVTVVDPSPDALAALARRAREVGVEVAGAAGRPRRPARPGRRRRAPTWCSATACSRWSTTRPPPWPRSARCCAPAAGSRSWSPSGTPRSSPGRWPATSRRRSRCWPTRPTRPPVAPATGSPPTRSPALLAGAGFEVGSIHGVRVFADLVPGTLLDLEPGAAAALVELERAVSERAEYLPLATQLHVIAQR